MPNWCYNKLTVTGPEKDVQKFKKDARPDDKDAGDLSLSKLYPMPKELEHTKSPATVVSDAEYEKARKEAEESNSKSGFDMGLPISQSMSDELISKYGSNNWYDWSIAHWGTKWDVREATLDEMDSEILEYKFDTAWSPPIVWLDEICKKYPTLRIQLQYEEEGNGFIGVAVAKGGSLVQDESISIQ